MSNEQSRISPAVFATSFDLMYQAAIAADAADQKAWMRVQESWTGGLATYPVWQLTATEHHEDTRVMHYERWWPGVDERRVPAQVPRLLSAPEAPADMGFNRLTIPRLSITYGPHAPDVASLSAVAERLVGFANTDLPAAAKRDVRLALGVLLGRSFELQPHAYAGERSDFSEVLAGLDAERRGGKHSRWYVGEFIGHMLAGSLEDVELPATVAKNLPSLTNETTRFQAASHMESADALPDSFWLAYGIQNGVIFTSPNVLRLVYDKLQDPDQNILGEVAWDGRQAIIRSYVKNMLQAYAADPRRDQELLHSLSPITRRMRDNEVLGGLIAFAKGITPALNERLRRPQDGSEVALRPLDPRKLHDITDALTRILYFTSKESLDLAELGQMYETDMMHLENIEQIRMRLRLDASQPDVLDLRLRHAAADVASLESMLRDARNTGKSPLGIDARLRSRQTGRGPVDGHNIMRSGYGLLS